MNRISLCLVGLALLLVFGPHAGAQAKKSGDLVKASVEAGKPDADGNQTVTLTLAIDKGWHLYANPVENKDLIDAQTSLKLGGKGKPELVKVEYPAGTVVKDKVVGDYRVYENKVSIKAVVKRAKGATEPLEFGIAVQACNDRTCLTPDTVKVKVP